MTHATELPTKEWASIKFWPLVEIAGKDDCWPWIGPKLGRGYGAIQPKAGKARTGAHRFSYAIHNGVWPDSGLVVMHSCDNPACVNPAHLSVGTHSENIKDCVSKGRHKPFHPAKKDVCKNGHAYTAENTAYVIDGGLKVRRCRQCSLATNRKYAAKRAQMRCADLAQPKVKPLVWDGLVAHASDLLTYRIVRAVGHDFALVLNGRAIGRFATLEAAKAAAEAHYTAWALDLHKQLFEVTE